MRRLSSAIRLFTCTQGLNFERDRLHNNFADDVHVFAPSALSDPAPSLSGRQMASHSVAPFPSFTGDFRSTQPPTAYAGPTQTIPHALASGHAVTDTPTRPARVAFELPNDTHARGELLPRHTASTHAHMSVTAAQSQGGLPYRAAQHGATAEFSFPTQSAQSLATQSSPARAGLASSLPVHRNDTERRGGDHASQQPPTAASAAVAPLAGRSQAPDEGLGDARQPVESHASLPPPTARPQPVPALISLTPLFPTSAGSAVPGMPAPQISTAATTTSHAAPTVGPAHSPSNPVSPLRSSTSSAFQAPSRHPPAHGSPLAAAHATPSPGPGAVSSSSSSSHQGGKSTGSGASLSSTNVPDTVAARKLLAGPSSRPELTADLVSPAVPVTTTPLARTLFPTASTGPDRPADRDQPSASMRVSALAPQAASAPAVEPSRPVPATVLTQTTNASASKPFTDKSSSPPLLQKLTEAVLSTDTKGDQSPLSDASSNPAAVQQAKPLSTVQPQGKQMSSSSSSLAAPASGAPPAIKAETMEENSPGAPTTAVTAAFGATASVPTLPRLGSSVLLAPQAQASIALKGPTAFPIAASPASSASDPATSPANSVHDESVHDPSSVSSHRLTLSPPATQAPPTATLAPVDAELQRYMEIVAARRAAESAQKDPLATPAAAAAGQSSRLSLKEEESVAASPYVAKPAAQAPTAAVVSSTHQAPSAPSPPTAAPATGGWGSPHDSSNGGGRWESPHSVRTESEAAVVQSELSFQQPSDGGSFGAASDHSEHW
jgi:hypothetical protein